MKGDARDSWTDGSDGSADLAPIPLIVVPHRESRLGARLWPAVAILAVALVGIVYRASVADWQGWTGRGVTSVAGHEPSPPPRPSPKRTDPPIDIALAPPPVKEEPPKVVPSPEKAPDVEPAPKPKVDPWKEIEREAAKKKAELAELDKLKADEAEKARSQPLRQIPPPDRPRLEAALDAMQREMLEQIERAGREQLAAQRRMIEQFRNGRGLDPQRQMHEMMRQQQAMFDQMRRMAGPGFPPLPPMPDLPGGGFPVGRARPGTRVDRQTIRTPNGLIIIERREAELPGPPGDVGGR